MVEFARDYPDKFFDVGIAEQHAVTFAAGAATQGIKPIVAIYSTFLQRGYDQLIHDVALQNLPVMFAIDRAGIVGADGPTHIGAFDLSYLRCIPNMVIMVPSNENECYQMLWTAYKTKKVCAVRYPRSTGNGSLINENMQLLALGKGEVVRQGVKLAILAFGTLVDAAVAAADELNATVCNMRFVKPLDIELIKTIVQEHDYIVTLEENVVCGGAGSACNEFLIEAGIINEVAVLNLGIHDHFPPHGDQKTLLADEGLDKAGIIAAIKQKWVNAYNKI